MTAVFTSYKISNSYAIFTDSIKGKETITLTLDKNLDKSGANKPVLSDSMIPVYYSDTDKQWHKADENNKDINHKWYDYDKKMWANSITYDHTKLANEAKTIEGKTFNGTSDYIDMGNVNVDFGKTITLVTRFKISELNDETKHIISNSENAGSYIYLYKNYIYFRIYSKEKSNFITINSIATAEKDKWYTVVGTYDGNVMKLYINGELEVEQKTTDTIKQSQMPFIIGANPNNNNVIRNYFKGTISDALVINGAIDENTIKKNYSGEVNHVDNSNQLFYSKFDNKIGNVNEAQYTNEGMTFDGENDYVNVGLANYDFDKEMTVVARFKTKASEEETQYLIGNAETSGFGLQTNFNIDERNTTVAGIAIYDTSKNSYASAISKTALEVGKWYTVVATYDGNNIKLYLNGELEDTTSMTSDIVKSTAPIAIGVNPGATYMRYFKGTISDALVMNKALSDDEAKELSKDNNFKDYAKNDNTLIYNNLREYEERENGTELPMDIISTMQVWIPRYKYKVWNYNEDGTKTSTPQPIEITFEKGTNKTGDITCEDKIQGESNSDGTSETCKINNKTCTDETCKDKTYTHPAFQFGEEELPGFWVGKFELSSDTVCTPQTYDNEGTGCNLNTIRPLIKPNLYSWRGVSISTLEDVAFAMKEVNNKYDFSNTDDIHMIKNSEWGAIAYLSHSKYGKNGEVKNNANSSFITGCGPESKESNETTTTCNSYNTTLGFESSTTGDIYGVYDMAGGAWEYTMADIVGKDGQTMISGFDKSKYSGYSGVLYNNGNFGSVEGKDLPDDKYYDKYSYNEADNIKNLKIHKLGDGTREIHRETNGWYDDFNCSLNAYVSWGLRGGKNSVNKEKAGIFAAYNSNSSSSIAYGNAALSESSRLIILSK